MRKISIIGLAIVFLVTHYSYTLASCELCGVEASEILNSITKPDTESLEEMFVELGIGDDIEQADIDGSYSFTVGNIEVTLVPLYSGGIYLFAEKEGNLLGAVKHDGVERTIIPSSIMPEQQSFLILICIVMIPVFLTLTFDAGYFCYTVITGLPTPENLLRCLFGATIAVASGFITVDLCFF